MTLTQTVDRRGMTIGQKAVWAVGAVLVVLLVWGAVAGDDPSAAYPVGAYAECDAFFAATGSDSAGLELMGEVITVARAAEGGPVEAEANELVDAAMSGDQTRSITAVRAMNDACLSG